MSKRILSPSSPVDGFYFTEKRLNRYKAKGDTPKEETPAFLPRMQNKRPLDGKYKDRAEMRRAGVNDEYKPVSDWSCPRPKEPLSQSLRLPSLK